jgi:signal transduction histidine kinase
VLNLVSNAIKFTPREGRVTVSAETSRIKSPDDNPVAAGRPAVRIRIEDTGIGVPEDSREKIFEAFYQVDSSSTREYGGTGLGLSIVKNFVEAHGGRVWVEPADRVGSVFLVEIPTHPTKPAVSGGVGTSAS